MRCVQLVTRVASGRRRCARRARRRRRERIVNLERQSAGEHHVQRDGGAPQIGAHAIVALVKHLGRTVHGCAARTLQQRIGRIDWARQTEINQLQATRARIGRVKEQILGLHVAMHETEREMAKLERTQQVRKQACGLSLASWEAAMSDETIEY